MQHTWIGTQGEGLLQACTGSGAALAPDQPCPAHQQGREALNERAGPGRLTIPGQQSIEPAQRPDPDHQHRVIAALPGRRQVPGRPGAPTCQRRQFRLQLTAPMGQASRLETMDEQVPAPLMALLRSSGRG